MSDLKTEPFDQPGSLMLATIKLLKGRNLLLIYKETNISFYWLRKLSVGAYANPSVNRVQYLYEYLTSTKIV